MGCHIDGFIAVVGHTHVLQQGPVTGRAADVVAAANTAAEVALRLVRPGKKVIYLKFHYHIYFCLCSFWRGGVLFGSLFSQLYHASTSFVLLLHF